jgi:DNA/RNA endonuclease YhcR with UshA esterase domain
VLVIAASLLHGGLAGAWTIIGPMVAADAGASVDHLVISEILTGGTSALELIYVTASGATVTRKAAWTADAAPVQPGAHLLVANEAGIYASGADAVYANGLAATGGSVALRAAGAASAIDAVGWGSAASAWLEGSPAPAPAVGHSLERLPGGSAGSWQDTDQNADDFVDRTVPEPQAATSDPTPAGSPAPSPSPSPSQAGSPTPSASPTPPASATPLPTAPPTATPSPTLAPSPTAGPTLVSIDTARSQPDGTLVTVEGVTLTDGGFTDGGGYLLDATAGIAVLVSDGTFPRGVLLRVSGEIDDRYHQRTLRATLADLQVGDAAADPTATVLATGTVGEASEATLVRIAGEITSSLSSLTAGVAFDVDDGSGAVRVVVSDVTGIDTSTWQRGMTIDTIGVVGQRDSSGSGTEGYRVQPRDAADVIAVGPGPSPSGTPSADPSASPSPSATAVPDDAVPIADARLAPSNTRLTVRGVVTLPTGLLGDGTAALQDATGGIVLRIDDEYGPLALGELVAVDGVRSTKSGMETLRVSSPPLRLGTALQPSANPVRTGNIGEADEAQLVLVRGSVVAAPRRTTAQNVYLDLDDGSGPIRVFVTPGAGIDTAGIVAGEWVQLTGVVGQETSGQQPLRGYRIWPRVPGDIEVLAVPDATTPASQAPSTASASAMPATATGGSSGIVPQPSLPAPRLAASALQAATASDHRPELTGWPAATAGPARGAADRPPVQLALLAVMVLGAAGTAAARRPGIGARVRAAAGRLVRVPDSPEDGSDPGGERVSGSDDAEDSRQGTGARPAFPADHLVRARVTELAEPAGGGPGSFELGHAPGVYSRRSEDGS